MTSLGFTVPGLALEVPIEVLVLGAVTGLTYSVLAVGLVLAYRSSRVLNFAHGEMGALAGGLVPVLVAIHGWNYWPAVLAALAAGAAAGAVTEFAVVRPLARASRLIALVGTIGIAQVFFALGTFIPKGETLGSVTYPVPFDLRLGVGRLQLNGGHLLILFVVPAVTLALTLFFRRSNVGVAARAAAENRDSARLAGIPVKRISLVVWILAGLTAGLAAVLLGPTQPIVVREALGPGLLLRALAAAMMGGLVSLPWAFGGGLVVGVLELVVRWNYPTGGVLEMSLFALIAGSFLLRRGLGVPARGRDGSSWSLAGVLREIDPRVAAQPVVRRLRIAAPVAVLVAAFVIPMGLDNAQRVVMSSMVLFALMALSLVVLTGYAGQVSLGQFAFVALGAIVGGRLFELGYPHWIGLLYAVAAGGVAALLVGIPALRIRGLFLAVTTLAFAVAVDAWVYQQDWLVHVEEGRTSLEIPRPEFLGLASELRYLWLCIAVLGVAAAAVHHLRSTGTGRAMMAVRDNEPAAASLGISPRRAKITAFVISGALAALAGYLYGGLLVNFNDPAIFAPELSLLLLSIVVLGGVTTVTGAVAGAVFVRGLGVVIAPLLPSILGSSVALIIGGVGLLIAVLQFPGGVAGEIFKVRDRLLDRLVGADGRIATSMRSEGIPRPRLEARPDAETARRAGPALEAHDVTVRYDGHTAVDGVSLAAEADEILALVGPNGAGKTTLFDVLSGQVTPDRGRVVLHGTDITWWRPEDRARMGLGRTFQQAELFPEMRVDEVLEVALERHEPSETVPSILALPPSRAAERQKQIRARELVELLGLEPFAHLRAGELSTGTRRILELGTVVALGADVILLDEPTAGVAQREVEAFRPVLRELQQHLGATVVVIEHDLPMVLEVADRVVVLAAGRVIAEGPPHVIAEDPQVVATYLGTDERTIRRSGTRRGRRTRTTRRRPARRPAASSGTRR